MLLADRREKLQVRSWLLDRDNSRNLASQMGMTILTFCQHVSLGNQITLRSQRETPCICIAHTNTNFQYCKIVGQRLSAELIYCNPYFVGWIFFLRSLLNLLKSKFPNEAMSLSTQGLWTCSQTYYSIKFYIKSIL